MSEIDLTPYSDAVTEMAEFWRDTLSDRQVIAYARVLAAEPIEAVRLALNDLATDAKVTRFPLPAVVLERIRPRDTDEGEARIAASRVVAAVGKYGWTNPERAREFIGELGWKLVGLQGGWMQICQTLTEDNIATLQAQWRETGIALIKRARSGRLDDKPVLPQATADRLAALTDQATKALPEAP